ncbi:unnamed protein product [Rotaria socialis]|uniref:Orn/Lys/Arg decarboxylases family 1 pyridoxal-P attachment site domain-containing protein n=2 Tax=Rotaria socialis TaxID=392032 RepID=A0A818DA81_9BILA|nr:unnamed protein product [Rotaria socialis]CAF4569464.1 unnamed protein product [Rotaria socialis]
MTLKSDQSTSTMSNGIDSVDQTQMPFLESLLREKNFRPISFHMPGHKGTKEHHPMLLDYFGCNLNAADLVEINQNIDYLHSPKGALLKAQKLAAAAYGADETFFLINGSTVGNMAAIMSVVGPGQKIIMPRASHRSVYGAIVLSGAIPVYIEPDYHPDIGFPLAVSVQAVEVLLEKHPDVVAIHLTSPNYYGVLSDIGAICKLAHSHKVALLVDEAHGSHLGLHPDWPKSAVSLQADIIVHSTHKTQGSLTQSAMLHLNNNGLVNRTRVAQMLSLLQSSSPSSILLASLDEARMQMATEGRARLTITLALAQKARDAIRKTDGLWCYGDELIGVTGIFAIDPSKLIIRVNDIGLSGFKASEILRNEYKVDVEFADLRQIICSLTIADTESTTDLLIDALNHLSKHHRQTHHTDFMLIKLPNGLPRSVINVRDAYFTTKTRRVSLDEGVGHVLVESIIPYPPGVPLLVPGEIMEQHHLDFLRYFLDKGGYLVGMADPNFRTVSIVDS